MGTPMFAVPILDEIRKEHDVVLVVTQPDTYNLKKKKMVFNPVKEYCVSNNLECFQPEKIKKEYDKILATPCDLIVTAAYGQIIGEEVLCHPRLRCINVHGSLLPKHRGGAPIQRAIINGDSKTGITIMYMEKGMDTGDMLYQESIDILDSDNQDTMFSKLSMLGASCINKVISDLDKGLITPVKQDESLVTYSLNLTKEDEHIDFTKSNVDVFNQIRGLNSNPGAYCILDNFNVKVYNTKKTDKKHNGKTGVIIGINKDSFEVSCGNNSVIAITEIQFPSKKRMLVKDFLNGLGKSLITLNKEIK